MSGTNANSVLRLTKSKPRTGSWVIGYFKHHRLLDVKRNWL